MRHDWILDVLTDLRSYAQKNDLPALAAQVEVTLRTARAELAALQAAEAEEDDGDDGPGNGTGAPPKGLPH